MKWVMYLLQGVVLLSIGSIANGFIEDYLMGSGTDVIRFIGAVFLLLLINFAYGWWATSVVKFFKWE